MKMREISRGADKKLSVNNNLKTFVLAKSIVAHFGVPTLFVANKKSLLDDAVETFKTGIVGVSKGDIAQIKDGQFGETKLTKDTESASPIKAPIVVATIQSLHARIKDERTREAMLHWLRNVCKLVMIDETQAIGTKTWDEVLEECHAPYRVALSATPRRTDGATIKLQAYTGPWLYSTTAEKQIEQGRLCELDIRYIPFDHKLYNESDQDVDYGDMYNFCVVENDERNRECIVKPTMEMLEEGRHVLVLIMRIEHGQVLHSMFMEAGLSPDEVKFVWGETSDKRRTEAIQDFRLGKIKVMIGSVIFDAGVNVPIISGVVLGGAGNSDITHIQRIGRGARTVDYEKVLGYTPAFMQGKSEKTTLVYDIIDQNTKFFKKQSLNRYYNARDEFGRNRVSIVGGDHNVLKKASKRTTENTKQVDQLSAQLEMLREFSEK